MKVAWVNKILEHGKYSGRRLKNNFRPGFQDSRRLSEGGWTLVELMLVTALIAIIVPAITFLFLKSSQGFAADEMHLQLKALNSQTMLHLHEQLGLNKHLFQNDTTVSGGVTYLGRLDLSSAPATVAGTHLPLAQPVGQSLSPKSGATSADFGNALFFAAFDSPQTINNVTYQAPITINGTYANNVTFGTTAGGCGCPATIVLDTYRFYYYYLTSTNSTLLVPSYKLVEWESVQFLDYFEITDITDTTLRQRVINYLVGQGYTLGWDPTQPNPNQAFYVFSGSTGTLTPGQNIPMAAFKYLTRVSSGILTNGFNYGVCGNGIAPSDAPSVPEYAAASGSFPGGFEVGITGSGSGVELMTRILLVGRGATAPRVVWDDITTINNVKDIW